MPKDWVEKKKPYILANRVGPWTPKEVAAKKKANKKVDLSIINALPDIITEEQLRTALIKQLIRNRDLQGYKHGVIQDLADALGVPDKRFRSFLDGRSRQCKELQERLGYRATCVFEKVKEKKDDSQSLQS